MNSTRFISEKIYLLTLFVWIIVSSLITTTYFVRLDGALSIYRLSLYATIAIILIKELFNLSNTMNYFRFHLKQMILFILFILSMLIVSKNRDGLLDITVILLVTSARDIDFKKLLKTFSYASFSVLAITIFSSNSGIISNMYMNVNGGYRYSLGFNYVSFASQRTFFAICSYLMYKGRKISYFELFSFLILTIYMFQQTGTTSPFYLSLLIILYTCFSNKIFKKDFIIDNGWLTKIVNHCFSLALTIILYFCFYSSGMLYHLTDKFTHNRLRLSVEGFHNFGVSVFGRPISFTTFDIFGNFSSNYNFIDSSFVQLLVIDGLLVTLFMLPALTGVVSYFKLKRRDTVLACIGIMTIHGMFDPQMLVLRYSPLILLISRLFIMNDERNIE